MKKTLFYFILAVSAITLHSCLEGYNDSTPVIRHSVFLHNWKDSTNGDTLHIYAKDDMLLLDTIAVDDSVLFYVQARSYANSLVSLVFEYDSTLLNFNFPNIELSDVLDTARCDIKHGKYIFKPYYTEVVFGVKYYAKQTGKSPIKMTVTSDANTQRVSNTYSLEFQQSIR